MKFSLTIELGNDAMKNRFHIIKTLGQVAKKVADNQQSGKIMDVNGNSVGTWELEECSHEHQYLSDKNTFVCEDCDEDLGR